MYSAILEDILDLLEEEGPMLLALIMAKRLRPTTISSTVNEARRLYGNRKGSPEQEHPGDG